MKIHNRGNKRARIEMMPLIDIVFLLLVFFIYAMLSMAVHRGMQLDLPESSQAEMSKESPLSLSIRQGKSGLDIFLGEQHVTLNELQQQVNTLQNSSDKSRVLVFAQEDITYQQLYQVLDELKKSSINDISLQASPE